MDIWIYDVEVYCNLFMVTFKHKDTKGIKKFLIFGNRNDLYNIVAFCNRPNTLWLVGYNNHSYDNQMLNFIILNYWLFKHKKPDEITEAIFKVSQDFFAIQNAGGYYNKYMYGGYFNSVDLMRIHGLHKVPMKGLKQVAINLKFPRIQDLPIPFDKPIRPDQVEQMFDYNLNDCDITLALYEHAVEKVRLRKAVGELYDVQIMSEADSGIANKIFEKIYADKTGLHPKAFKDLKTERFKVSFRDAIKPHIKFRTKELQKVLDDVLNEFVICNTGKVTFTLPTFRIKATEYQVGAGGLHSVDKGAVFESCSKYRIIDADVTSYYPAIIVNNGIKPEHLSEDFIQIMADIMKDRVEAKKTGNTVRADALKIVVNSIYGKLGFGQNFFYDPLAMIQVTMNGQFALLMLIERLEEAGFQVISANTDGITTKVERVREHEYMEICNEWSKEVNFGLEYAYYWKYIRRDVNNYLVVKEIPEGEEFNYKKHVKTKGDLDPYLYKDVTKGFDKPVVALAVYNHFVHNIPIQKTIREHKDIYDFCMSKKNDSSYDNEYYTVENGEVTKTVLQKSNRFFIVTRGNGGKLIKAKDDIVKGGRKKAQQVAGYPVAILNDYYKKDMKDYNIDYMYYIIEAQKIIDAIVPKQQSLFL